MRKREREIQRERLCKTERAGSCSHFLTTYQTPARSSTELNQSWALRTVTSYPSGRDPTSRGLAAASQNCIGRKLRLGTGTRNPIQAFRFERSAYLSLGQTSARGKPTHFKLLFIDNSSPFLRFIHFESERNKERETHTHTRHHFICSCTPPTAGRA